METKIKPIGDRVLVEPHAGKENIKNGIVIPETAKEKPQEGEIIAVGTGKTTETGSKIEFAVKVGDTVIFSKYGGTEVKVDDRSFLVMREEDILAVLEK